MNEFEFNFQQLSVEQQALVTKVHRLVTDLASMPDDLFNASKVIAELSRGLRNVEDMRTSAQSFSNLYKQLPWLTQIGMEVWSEDEYTDEGHGVTNHRLKVISIETDGSVDTSDPEFNNLLADALMYTCDIHDEVFDSLAGLNAFNDDLPDLYNALDHDKTENGQPITVLTERATIELAAEQGPNALAEVVFPTSWRATAPLLGLPVFQAPVLAPALRERP